MSTIEINDTSIITSNSALVTDSNKLGILHELARIGGFEDPVPDINTFIDDPYYLGKYLGAGIYPIWREAANKLYPSPYHSPYQEVVLTGGIGLGKTTGAILITLYDVCRVLSLKDPHKHYSLIESTIISFALMNATKGLAGAVLYDQMIEWIENSPYFKSKLAPKGSRSLFIKNIDITMGSRGRDMLGQATLGAIFSEINDMNVVGNQASDNFDTIATRRESRFGRKGEGKEILGHLILDSSSKGNRSFIDSRIEDKKKKGIKDFVVFSYTHWQAKWHIGGYSGKFFQVFAGDTNRDPFIINDENKHLLEHLDQSRIIDVPVEHQEDFHFNIYKALQDLAGVNTFSTFSFLSSAEVIKKVFTRPQIIQQSIIVLDFFDEKQTLDQYLDLKMCMFLCKKPRFIHIDLGLKHDSTGIACSYLEGYTDTVRADPHTGKQVINREPIFVTEWIMEIRCIPGQEVPIYKIKEFILLAKRMGLPIAQVSTDGFQSSNLRQDLKLKGVETELISVDRTKDPYNLLRNAMMEGRHTAPNSEKLIKEIRELEDVGAKYDHPEAGSKDLIDAMCGSVWACSQNINKAGTVIDAAHMVDTLSAALGNSSKNKFEALLGINR
ncbi:hypothetical protein [Ralstonia phage RP13]|nr:hypothetical protein [Ralstonia phage RP13]